MSFKTRERHRRKNAAINRDQQEAHKSGSAAGNWYLTFCQQPCTCNNGCGRHFRASTKTNPVEIVYRKLPMTIYCIPCAQDLKLPYRPSRSWEDAHPVRRVG